MNYSRRFSTNGNSFKGLFSSVNVIISVAGEMSISCSFLGLSTVVYRGGISDVVSMDLVSTTSVEQVYFHARIGFKDGQSYELPLPTVELTTPGSFEELRERVGLIGSYASIEGPLPIWGPYDCSI